jgi:hypothetical protein
MKRIICLLTLTFALVLLNTSCTKSTDDVLVLKTLTERYPDWKNLTWVSTNGQSSIDTYPKLAIKITNDTVANVIQTWYDSLNGIYNHDYTFLGLSVNENTNTATFGDPTTINTSIEMVGNLIFTISSFDNTGKITLSTNRFVDKSAVPYIFVLQKN